MGGMHLKASCAVGLLVTPESEVQLFFLFCHRRQKWLARELLGAFELHGTQVCFAGWLWGLCAQGSVEYSIGQAQWKALPLR